ncbi:photosystem reaction center subunit H [Methylobacterium sp. J-077]|uniref:photosystem reaction center subunit H n=1 Tax=Methylobacterium sp. J-077 TaxID=2836656 RepID=UPI001FBBCE2F|nr:photosystem reaction center subunit H [Methylobacterium sp. J-077]MCJ2126215.1 photosystem reaction center subunit H [Methylobacterium sp. J-077]
MRRPLIAPALVLAMTASAVPARAACDVKGAQIEEAIAAKKELREDANAQTVRDLRTLRDAAIVLETYKFPGECEVLLGIAKSLLANPDKTIVRGGDTDEDEAESLVEAREPKAKVPADEKAPATAKAPAAKAN